MENIYFIRVLRSWIVLLKSKWTEVSSDSGSGLIYRSIVIIYIIIYNFKTIIQTIDWEMQQLYPRNFALRNCHPRDYLRDRTWRPGVSPVPRVYGGSVVLTAWWFCRNSISAKFPTTAYPPDAHRCAHPLLLFATLASPLSMETR